MDYRIVGTRNADYPDSRKGRIIRTNKMNTFTVGGTADILIGAGIAKLDSNLNISLSLIGVGVALKILVAFLNRAGVEVRSRVVEG